MPATVTDIRTRQVLRTKFADLCAPSREDDEKLLRVIRGFEERGKVVVFPGEGREAGEAATPTATTVGPASPDPFVSPYLLQPIRSEDEVRALLNRPRPKPTLWQRIWGTPS